MKKIMSILLLLMLNGICWANLLKNPSFEIQQEANSSMPESWSVIKKGTFETSHESEEKIVFSGKRAISIHNPNPKLKKAVLLWCQNGFGEQFKKIPAGTLVEYSVMATAVDKPCNVKIYFESIKFRKTHTARARVVPGKWSKISVKFKKQDMVYISPNVYIQLTGNGKAVFDCAYLGDAAKNPYSPAAGNTSYISGGDAEGPEPGVPPFGWSILKRSKNGTAAVEENIAASGKRSFLLKCDANPQGMLSWKYTFDRELLKSIPPGTPMILTLKVNTAGNPGTKFNFYVEFMRGRKFIGTAIARNQSSYVNWTEKALKFNMPKEIPTSAAFYMQLLTAGTLNFDDVTLKRASDMPKDEKVLAADDYCRISSVMPISNTFISPAFPKKFELEMTIPHSDLTVELHEIDGKKIQEWKFNALPVRKRHKLTLNLKNKLPENAYELRFKSGTFTDYEWFRIRPEQTAGARFNEERILILNSKKFFPIGIVTPDNNLDSLRVYSQSGINTVQSALSRGGAMGEYIVDTLEHYQLKCIDWDNYGLNPNHSDEKIRKDLKARAAFLAKQKVFIGFLNDEAPWNGWDIRGIRQHFKMRYKYLPDHILWMNHAPRLNGAADEPRQSFQSVRKYSRASMVLGIDIYPVPEGTGHNNLKNKTIACVGEYVDLVKTLSWNTKPVWMILQAFGWSEEGGGVLDDERPRPTEKQLRFMIYNAITHGARGIFWFGKGAKDVYSDWWRSFARVNLELKAVSELLLADTIREMKNLPDGLSGVENKAIKIIVNENQKKAVNYNGTIIEGQGVLFITDKKIEIPLPPKFVKQTQKLTKDYKFRRETVLMDAQWTAHPEYLRGEPKNVHVKHDFVLTKKPAEAYFQCSVDDDAELFLNGKYLGKVKGFRSVSRFNVVNMLVKGNNQFTAVVENQTGPTGFVYELVTSDGRIASGKDTRYSFDGKTDWKNAELLGKPPVNPWKKPTVLQFCN